MTANQAIIREIPIAAIVTESNIRVSNGYDAESIGNLADSIRAHGLIQPIVIRQIDDDDNAPELERARFAVVAGRRRLAACAKLGMSAIPCIVSDTDEAKAYELEIAENIQREQMTLSDTARAVRTLMLIYDNATQVGKIVNKSPAWVSKHLTITAKTFPVALGELLESGAVQDLETLLLLNQIHKRGKADGYEKFSTLVRLAACGDLSREKARQALASLTQPAKTPAPPPPVTVTTTSKEVKLQDTPADPDETKPFTVFIPARLIQAFLDRGGDAWLIAQLEGPDAQTATS